MPRGGKRPGAGRPRGSSSKKAKVSAAVAAADGMKPLDIMIAIMRRYYSEERFDKALARYFSQKFAPTDQSAVPHLEQGLRLFANQPNAGRSAAGQKGSRPPRRQARRRGN